MITFREAYEDNNDYDEVKYFPMEHQAQIFQKSDIFLSSIFSLIRSHSPKKMKGKNGHGNDGCRKAERDIYARKCKVLLRAQAQKGGLVN